MRAAAVLVAAGSSRRMGFDKLAARLAGRSVVEWSLEAFEKAPSIDLAILVCAPDRIAEFTALAAPFHKFRKVIAGGAERGISVRNGLEALSGDAPDLVAVHDAARPLVTPGLIEKTLASAAAHHAASAAQPVSDSLHRADAAGALHETVCRQGLFAMQTPQAARFDLLLAALQAHHAGATDEVSALIAAGIHPRAVMHDAPNFKITHPQDLALAEVLLQLRTNP